MVNVAAVVVAVACALSSHTVPTGNRWILETQGGCLQVLTKAADPAPGEGPHEPVRLGRCAYPSIPDEQPSEAAWTFEPSSVTGYSRLVVNIPNPVSGRAENPGEPQNKPQCLGRDMRQGAEIQDCSNTPGQLWKITTTETDHPLFTHQARLQSIYGNQCLTGGNPAILPRSISGIPPEHFRVTVVTCNEAEAGQKWDMVRSNRRV